MQKSPDRPRKFARSFALLAIGLSLCLPPAGAQRQERWVVVPDLRSLHLNEAENVLRERGLVPGEVTFRPSREPEGTVLEQDPEPGSQVPAGTAVRMVAARPAEEERRVPVPELRGLEVPQAEELLRIRRLEPGGVEERLSPEPEGTVVAQEPPAGTEVLPGTPVHLTVARWVEVPLLIDRFENEIEVLLERSRLRRGNVRREDSDRPPGTVLFQEPEAGTRAPIDAPVHVVVARSRRATTSVPATTSAFEPTTSAAPTGGEPSDRPATVVAWTDRWPWWPLAVFGLLSSALLTFLAFRKRAGKPRPASRAADLEVTSHKGEPRTTPDDSLRVSFDVSLRGVVDHGEQTLDGLGIQKVEKL
jgi:beta-lactam-binding protein with PASTA domain